MKTVSRKPTDLVVGVCQLHRSTPLDGGMQLLLFTFLNFKDCQRQKSDTRLRRESAERPSESTITFVIAIHISIIRM